MPMTPTTTLPGRSGWRRVRAGSYEGGTVHGVLKRPQCRGFSLLEVAIVVLILGLLLGGLLVPLSVQRENQDRAETQATLEEIKEALYGFALVNGYLPCPDTDGDGAENEDRDNGRCDQEFGTVPSADLGVRRLDAWGQPLRFHVTEAFAAEQFDLDAVGQLMVRDSADGGVVATNLPIIVLSRGKNWAVSTSPDELANEDATDTDLDLPTRRTYVFRGYSQKQGAEFDDLLIWISPPVLMNRMIAAGKLPK